jgi:hypothetical protein
MLKFAQAILSGGGRAGASCAGAVERSTAPLRDDRLMGMGWVSGDDYHPHHGPVATQWFRSLLGIDQRTTGLSPSAAAPPCVILRAGILWKFFRASAAGAPED